LNGSMLKSFDPNMVEHNQFGYAIPEDLEIPSPQNSSFVIVSEGDIFTINYQLSYELNENFLPWECDMVGSSEIEFDSIATSSTTDTKIPFIYFILAVGLILLICGVAGVLVFNRKSS
jgi:hypothetical protein